MDTRQQLLEHALRLFAARGYESVGVQEIVEAAGVTKPPLYHHFGSKEGLLQALLDEQFGALEAALSPALRYQGDLPLTLFNVAQAFIQFARERPAFQRLQLALWFSAPDSDAHRVVHPYRVRQQQLLEELFRSVVRDHGNLRGHHATYAVTFLAIVNAYTTPGPVPAGPRGDELVHRAVKQFMYGIYAL